MLIVYLSVVAILTILVVWIIKWDMLVMPFLVLVIFWPAVVLVIVLERAVTKICYREKFRS
jgi:hypothetical protein